MYLCNFDINRIVNKFFKGFLQHFPVVFNATYYKLKIIQWKHLKNAVSLKNPHHILKVSKSIFTIIKPHPENNTQRKKKKPSAISSREYIGNQRIEFFSIFFTAQTLNTRNPTPWLHFCSTPNR